MSYNLPSQCYFENSWTGLQAIHQVIQKSLPIVVFLLQVKYRETEGGLGKMSHNMDYLALKYTNFITNVGFMLISRYVLDSSIADDVLASIFPSLLYYRYAFACCPGNCHLSQNIGVEQWKQTKIHCRRGKKTYILLLFCLFVLMVLTKTKRCLLDCESYEC